MQPLIWHRTGRKWIARTDFGVFIIRSRWWGYSMRDTLGFRWWYFTLGGAMREATWINGGCPC